MEINREWAMPSGDTFSIKPIKSLFEKYYKKKSIIVDPFAKDCKLGTLTNDLNPSCDTNYHLDALDFLKTINNEYADMVLYDPPYSITQASQLYKNYGRDKLDISVSNMAYWAKIKDNISRIIKPGGICISCGWNTNGIGKCRNFEILEILIIAHGGSKNDTLVTVGQKLKC